MGKQPYIPFYTGDYLKDTRVLPLAVRGAWVDLLIFMWDAPVRGELVGTLEDFARMMSCERSEAEFALNLLKQKSTADFILLPTGETKIISRKMKRESEISEKRSNAGKKGIEAKFAGTFAEAKRQAKPKQNPDIDIDIEYDTVNNKKERDFTKPDIRGDEIVLPFDTDPMRKIWAGWKQYRWNAYKSTYPMMGEQADLQRLNGMTYPEIEKAILEAIAKNWKHLYPEHGKQQNNNGFNGKPRKESPSDVAADFARRHGTPPPGGKI